MSVLVGTQVLLLQVEMWAAELIRRIVKRASLSTEQYVAVMQKISKQNFVSSRRECQRGKQNT